VQQIAAIGPGAANWRFVRTAGIGAQRGEGSQTTLRAEMYLVQQSDHVPVRSTVKNGPFLPLIVGKSAAARLSHCCHSCIPQHFVLVAGAQLTNRPFTVVLTIAVELVSEHG